MKDDIDDRSLPICAPVNEPLFSQCETLDHLLPGLAVGLPVVCTVAPVY